jgi:hypothetical protein
MKKRNCWEFMKCGRGIGGDNNDVCPVAAEKLADGLNEGVNGGRLCWVIAEACCNNEVKCSELHRKSSCFSCEFRFKVNTEEGLLNVCKATGEFLAATDSKKKNK